jgi:AcrR family transcriptional regulator
MTSAKQRRTAPIRRRQPKGEKGRRTKAIIQQAIVDLVSVEGLGLNEIKLDRICRKAGVTIGAFYFHFENKDAAIEETAIDVLNEFQESLDAIASGGDLYSELRSIILAFIRSLVERPKETRLVYTAIRSSPAVHQVYEKAHLQTAGRIEALIAGAREEAGRNTGQSQLIAEFLLAGIESFNENVYMWDNPRVARLGEHPEQLANRLAAMWVNVATTRLEVET